MTIPKSRHSAPIFKRDGQEPVALTRVSLGGLGHNGDQRENFIQDLVYRHPELIPIGDIEPAFTPLVSVCKELPTESGYLDNLWITPAGGIVLGECKLVKNPQARREVVVQALDYARAISRWHYEQFENAVQKALKSSDAKIWNFVSTETDEGEFIEAVERRLRLGHFLILIIGDGIQEGVEALTSHLQMHAGIHASLALVDLSIWQGIEGGLLVVPRIPLKTVIVERGIVRIDDSNRIRIDPPAGGSGISPASVRSQTSSESEFYVQLELKRPGLSEKLRLLVDQLAGAGIEPEPGGKSLFLRWKFPAQPAITIACIEPTGKVWSARVLSEARRVGMAEAAEKYLTDVAAAVGGYVKPYENGSKEVLTADGKAVDLDKLLAGSQWREAMVTLTETLATKRLE
ncbi:MAG: hypothetical protein JHD07_03945 [Bradyrhizobium sp.]|uniref:hypothetical protein n=1 Tax=Bradyrhizobium sp. TaxID=376 RepID=UPI001A316063|nr:hypothetical protein [Bradyrhizobium sp.]MBJ7402476.1 hypothetical protein [Bradyrhizobium sp.]